MSLVRAVAFDDAAEPLDLGFRFRRPFSLRVSFGFRFRQPFFDLSFTNDVRKHCTHLQDKCCMGFHPTLSGWWRNPVSDWLRLVAWMTALDGHRPAAVGAAGLGGGFAERPA